MSQDEIRAELKTLRERVRQLEKELEESDRQQEESGGGFPGYYNNSRDGIGGPQGGGRTARPQRGKYHY